MQALKKLFPFLLSAIVFAVAMDFPQKLWVFSFFFLLPIIHTMANKKLSAKELAVGMMVFGLVGFSLSTLWFLSVYPLDWLGITGRIAVPLIGIVWFLFVGVLTAPIIFWPRAVHVFQGSNVIYNSVVASLLWSLLEYVRSWAMAIGLYGEQTLFGPHHTYYSLGYLVTNIPFMKDLLPMGGLYFSSFIIVVLNYAIYNLRFVSRKSWLPQTLLLLVVLITVAGTHLFIEKQRSNATKKDSIVVAVANARVSSSGGVASQREKELTTKGILEAIHQKINVLVLPENFNALYPQILDKKVLKDLMDTFPLTVGSYSGEHYSNLFFYSPKENQPFFYRKQLLMPVAEYGLALLDVLHFKAGRNLLKGEGNSLFRDAGTGITYFGSLCSENISSSIYRDATHSGAMVLINLASHAPFHGSELLSRQSLAINIARALENGRYFIVASNYDKSYVISNKGELISLSPLSFSTKFFSISPEVYLTPFVRYENFFVYITGAYFLLLFIWKDTTKKRFEAKS